ncbi:MAG TPA: universal stress protein [Nitrospira sp.]|nr:universal stress protein [Nitrospira sp.]
MKVVAGVDWSDAAFAAVEQLGLLYRPDEVTLVHGVDLGLFEYPIVAEAANLQGYDIFKKSMYDAGWESLERASTMLPDDIPKPNRLCEFGKPARFLLDTASSVSADLIVVGTHDHSRVAELVLTSVSHRVLLHAMQPTLLVKGRAKQIRRVLIAIEGRTDGMKTCDWLIRHPFRMPVDAMILTALPILHVLEESPAAAFATWSEEITRQAEETVRACAQRLPAPAFTTSTRVMKGDPAPVVSDVSREFDLVIVGSHGREGLDRFLLGSVSHAIVHHVACPVLVVR